LRQQLTTLKVTPNKKLQSLAIRPERQNTFLQNLRDRLK
jgi:hypothetical protein